MQFRFGQAQMRHDELEGGVLASSQNGSESKCLCHTRCANPLPSKKHTTIMSTMQSAPIHNLWNGPWPVAALCGPKKHIRRAARHNRTNPNNNTTPFLCTEPNRYTACFPNVDESYRH